MTHRRTVTCDWCETTISLDGNIGRPPHYCNDECRRAGRAADERIRRAERKREIDRLRSLVSRYEAALVA